MPNYILRNLPDPIWSSFRAKAAAEGWPLRALLIGLIEDYAAGRIHPSGSPPTRRPIQLSMRPIAHVRKGEAMTEDRLPVQYEVLGLPPGQLAWISYFPGQMWMILRSVDGVQDSTWREHHQTAQHALRAIEREINRTAVDATDDDGT